MSYCRFENTYYDLKDCLENLDEADDLSESEARYRLKLIKMCVSIAADYAWEVGDDAN
jgi:hypothetical protein